MEEHKLKKRIIPLYINGLTGRMLRLPAPVNKKREILLIYGHHASIERLSGIAEDLNQYGAVTMPDLPGFGGMDSFYKIGMKPTLDNMADYLASFVKMQYKRKKVTIAAMSFGFIVVTRMLQRYPELTKKVNMLISVVGFSHHDDFIFSKPRYLAYRYASALFSGRLSSAFFRNVFLHPLILRLAYTRTRNAKSKFTNLTPQQHKANLDFEIQLWHTNDLRTHMYTSVIMLTIDNCQKEIDLPVWHISVSSDQYFNHAVVEQHMRIIFKDFIEAKATLPAHAPSIIATKKDAAPLIPLKMRRALAVEPQ